jgi:arabinogalactan oligomer/maltooligosaccharide transport system permease protein
MTTTNAPTLAPRVIKKKRRSFPKWAVTTGWKHLIGLGLVVYSVFPILYIISVSVTPGLRVEDSNNLFANGFSFDAYFNLFNDPDRPFARWFANSVVVGLTTSLLSVFICSLAAYAFSRLRFRGRRGGLMTLILIQMYPSLLGLVAIYGILENIGRVFPPLGLDSLLGLIMVYLGGSLGGGTYLMYGFFNTVPKEIDEAAALDGASHARIFFTIILRLVSPILAVQMLLSFIGIISDYVLPSILMSHAENLTFAVGLQQFISDPYTKDWTTFCAGAVLVAAPVVALFMYLQRYIVSGLMGGAVKG